MQDIINKLINALGPNKVLTDDENLSRYARDFWPLLMMREQVLHEKIPKPLAVVVPGSVNDISLTLRIMNEYGGGIPIVVYGGGSSVTGASMGSGSIIIDITRLNKVLNIDTYDLTITVEAGAKLRDVEAELNSMGFSLRHIPQSFNYATIGGLIATMSSGQYSTLYGNVEDAILNLEVVLPTGEVIWLRRNTVPRASTGPSLKYLFVGSEGMLGIITKAILRIVPLPKSTRYGSFTFNAFTDGIKVLRELMTRRLVPAVARLYDEYESSIRFGVAKPTLIISFEGYYDNVIGVMWNEARRVIEDFGGEYVGEDYFENWLSSRFNVEEEIDRVKKLGLWFDTIEVAGTWSRLPQIYARFRDAVMRVDGVVAIMAHISHLYLNGACIYFTVLFKPIIETYWKLWDAAMNAVLVNGGSISHHHGIGMLRSKWIDKELGDAVKIVKLIKNTLDPNSVMNTKSGMFFPDNL
jgi:alkyldihydroxyacetonephosphate synthase